MAFYNIRLGKSVLFISGLIILVMTFTEIATYILPGGTRDWNYHLLHAEHMVCHWTIDLKFNVLFWVMYFPHVSHIGPLSYRRASHCWNPRLFWTKQWQRHYVPSCFLKIAPHARLWQTSCWPGNLQFSSFWTSLIMVSKSIIIS